VTVTMYDRGGGSEITLKNGTIFQRFLSANVALNKHYKTCFRYFVIEYHSLLLRRRRRGKYNPFLA